jgi:hypothetical protein
MLLKLILPILVMLAIIEGCASPRTSVCLPGEQLTVMESLYFGTAKPGGVVTADEWATFLDTIVMPAFPGGLTSWAASGRWKTATDMSERETSYILQLAHDGDREKNTAIERIVHTYKKDFQQEAVLRIRSQACRSF